MKIEPKLVIENRYEIINKIGEGGMGQVWKATDNKLGDEVVLKFPLNHLDNEIIKRFSHEAKTMRRHSIDCPHILNIENYGMFGDTPWYAMRFLPGGSARNRIADYDQSDGSKWNPDSFNWLRQVASALDYLHVRETFHRDVKPENILFSREGTPYLVDFGIVKSASEMTTMLTKHGGGIGTLAYMAPETLEGEDFVAQSDQYALAVTLYEVITGDRPFGGTTHFALFKSISQGHQRLVECIPNISPFASAVVDQALSPEPDQRFGSCEDFTSRFIDALTETEESQTIRYPVPPVVFDPPPTAPEKPRKKPIFPPQEPVKLKPEIRGNAKGRSRSWLGNLGISLSAAILVWLVLFSVVPPALATAAVPFAFLGSAIVLIISFFGLLLIKPLESEAKQKLVSERGKFKSTLWWTTIVAVSLFWSALASIHIYLCIESYSLLIGALIGNTLFASLACLSIAWMARKVPARMRNICVAFVASVALGVLLFDIGSYAASAIMVPTEHTFEFEFEFYEFEADIFELHQWTLSVVGLSATLMAFGLFVWFVRSFGTHVFYCLLGGMIGQIIFACFFRINYSDYRLTGVTKFDGSLLLMILSVLLGSFLVPLLLKLFLRPGPSGFGISQDARALETLQLTIMIAALGAIGVWWTTEYGLYTTGAAISTLSCAIPLLAFWGALTYRRPASDHPVDSNGPLRYLGFLRSKPWIGVVGTAVFATLLIAIRFDWSMSLTETAASIGSRQSMIRMAERFGDGKGVVRNDLQTTEWYEKAAKRGSVEAQYELAEIYAGRSYSVDDSRLEDESEALFWYRKAAAQGHLEAQTMQDKLEE